MARHRAATTPCLEDATDRLARAPSLETLRAAAALLPGLVHMPGPFNALFWTLMRMVDTGRIRLPQDDGGRFFKSALAQPWMVFAQVTEDSLPPAGPRAPARRGARPRIAIVTHQILTPHHGRTAQVLDLAHGLVSVHDADVLVVNANSYPLVWESGIERQMIANTHPQLEGTQHFEVRGLPIALYSERLRTFDAEKLVSIRTRILDFGPDCVIGYGGFNIASDLISRYVPVLLHPDGPRDPIGAAQIILGWPGQADRPASAGLGSWATPPRRGYVAFARRPLRDPVEPPRARVRLPAGASAIAVVTDRPNADLTAEVQGHLAGLLDREPSVHLVIAGLENGAGLIPALQRHDIRVHCLPDVTDLTPMLRQLDAMILPGAFASADSALKAMAVGIPVLAHDGEAGALLGPDRRQESIADSCNTVSALLNDAGIAGRLRNAAQDAAEDLFDYDLYLEHVMAQVRTLMTDSGALWPGRAQARGCTATA